MDKQSKNIEDLSLSEATSRLISHILKMGPVEVTDLLNLVEQKSFERKRKAPRYEFFGEVVYVVQGRAYTGFIKNISNDGVFIETSDSLETGEKIILSFELPHGEHVRVTGSIARLDMDGFGVAFDDTLEGNLFRLMSAVEAPASGSLMRAQK
ncbi:MAG: PilZ domain-containing protein [Desulfobacterales bacterium]|nr:PilZ domain-containing protein [Desulfobacterales bacterium]